MTDDLNASVASLKFLARFLQLARFHKLAICFGSTARGPS